MYLNLKILNPTLFTLTAALAILVFYGCGKDDPEPTNRVPIAHAAGNPKAEIGSIVKLDASLSSDPDGQALSYNWSFVSKPENSTTTIIGAGKELAEFLMDKAGTYEVELKVSDGTAEAMAVLTITNNTPVITEIYTATTPSMDDEFAQKGRTIYIYGYNFSKDKSENKVTVADINYEIMEIVYDDDGSYIHVIVPDDAVSGELKITIGDESTVSPTPIRIVTIPVEEFVGKNTHLEEKKRITPGSYFEIGARFQPLVNGKAVALSLRMPANGTYKVTLWDGASKSVLVTETIEITNRTVHYNFLSSEIPLEKDKVFMITVNADNWYNHIDEQDSQANQYPQTIGDFDYLSLGFHDGQDTEYPDEFPVNYMTKGADIIFAADAQ